MNRTRFTPSAGAFATPFAPRLPALAVCVCTLGLALALSGCDPQDEAPDPAPATAQTVPDAVPSATPASDPESVPQDGADAVTDGYPDLTPVPLNDDAERGEAGARNVLIYFARGIELKEFGQAFDLLRDNARRNTTKATFARQFDGFGKITVAVPSGTMEGAAGTSYYTAPVTITGSNGQILAGQIVLSRVNDVSGASADQLRWRVYDFDVSAG